MNQKKLYHLKIKNKNYLNVLIMKSFIMILEIDSCPQNIGVSVKNNLKSLLSLKFNKIHWEKLKCLTKIKQLTDIKK